MEGHFEVGDPLTRSGGPIPAEILRRLA